MRTEEASPALPATNNLSLSGRSVLSWLRFLRSPLWLCLLLALLIRAWLVVHTQGVIAGDEAMVGLQAENILRGQHPVYYYGQPYMGSLEAYFAALLFAIAGPSVWTLRAVSILLSVLLVALTWRLAGALADTTQLPTYARRRFMIIAALVAALAPVYDAVIELRMMGGYIEAFVIMAWLLLSGFRLVQRWQAGASTRELALRWAGIGLLIGLGMWTDPLIISAVLAIALWIAGYIILKLVKLGEQSEGEQGAEGDHKGLVKIPRIFLALPTPPPSPLRTDASKNPIRVSSLLKGTLLLVAAIPAFCVGFVPAIIWGLKHQWQNMAYIFNNGSDIASSRLTTIVHIQSYYNTCIAPRIIGGALPSQADVTYTNPQLLTIGLVVGVFCIFASIAAIALSLYWRNPFLSDIRRLTGYPLLFAACSTLTFSVSNVSIRALAVGCGPWDLVGRYATPLLIAVPFFIAGIFTAISAYLQEMSNGQPQVKDEVDSTPWSRAITRSPFSMAVQAGLLILLDVYLGSQSYAYFTANAGYTFQTSACTMAPANNDQVIAFMQSQHIRYAWSHGWMGDPIAFKTDGAIVTADARFLTGVQPYLGRIPAYTLAVWHANRPSLLTLAKHDDANPPQLQYLATQHITYRVTRFSSEPGFDLLLITPLNRSITPSQADTVTQSSVFGYC